MGPELRSSAGFLPDNLGELGSNPGVLQSNAGLLALETPLPPMPVEQPLVRVLETYDLRKTPFLVLKGETGEHRVVNLDYTKPLDADGIPYSEVGDADSIPYSEVGTEALQAENLPVEEHKD
jgi:hypothetical protein